MRCSFQVPSPYECSFDHLPGTSSFQLRRIPEADRSGHNSQPFYPLAYRTPQEGTELSRLTPKRLHNVQHNHASSSPLPLALTLDCITVYLHTIHLLDHQTHHRALDPGSCTPPPPVVYALPFLEIKMDKLFKTALPQLQRTKNPLRNN